MKRARVKASLGASRNLLNQRPHFIMVCVDHRRFSNFAFLSSPHSGQGKSTVIQLIENYYHPDSGAIYYQGVDMKQLNVKWLRNQIGLVSQEPLLFDQSIAENIKFGMPEATQEDIEKAAKEANAHDFISK